MKNIYALFCLLLVLVFINKIQAQNPPTFTSTAVISVNGNENYTYGITTTDVEDDVVTLNVTMLPAWLTLTTTTQVSTFAGSTWGFADDTGATVKFHQLHALDGRLIFNKQISSKETTIPMANLNPATYLLKISNDKNF